MRKRFYTLFPIAFLIADVITLWVAFIASLFKESGGVYMNGGYWFTLLFATIGWICISLVFKDYKIGRSTEYSKSFNNSIRSTAVFISLISVYWIFFSADPVPRGFLAKLSLFLFLLSSFERVTTHLLLNRYRRWGGNLRRAVIVGYDNLGFALYSAFAKNKDHGIKCEGIYGNGMKTNPEYPFLGDVDSFFKSDIRELDLIYVSENIEKNTLNKIIELADEQFKKVKLLPNFKTDHIKTYALRVFENISVVDVNSLPLDSLFNRFLKRGFDIVFSVMVIVLLLSWLYPIISLLILLESRGPIIFKQWRNGRNNEPFICYKFRTMRQNDVSDSKWATKNDPRVTRIGALLRKTSLDELPQFINVLKGEMAIVGPRPLPVQLNEQYKHKVANYTQRHSYKPGITGLAQALGYRGEIRELYHIKNRVTLDRFYLRNWSFVFDIKIIFITILELFKGQEAAY